MHLYAGLDRRQLHNSTLPRLLQRQRLLYRLRLRLLSYISWRRLRKDFVQKRLFGARQMRAGRVQL